MTSPRIAIFGASGFVGTTLCERLYFSQEFDFVPIIHSNSGVARLARLPVEFRSADVLNIEQTRRALEGCDVIVNCMRGDFTAMEKGLQNMASLAQEMGVRRLVHLSSTGIYGSQPTPESSTESGRPSPNDPYGKMKFRQDQTIFKLDRKGVSSVLLCPGNISGPYSSFLLGAIDRVRAGKVVLVDDGQNPTNHVHVNNVVEGILAAIRTEKGGGKRFFLNESEPISWKRFYTDLAQLLGINPSFTHATSQEVIEAHRPPKNPSLMNQTRILLSAEFRRGLFVLPVFKSLNNFAFRQFNRLPRSVQKKFRDRFTQKTVIHPIPTKPVLRDFYIHEQIKTVRHSPKQAIENLDLQIIPYSSNLETDRLWIEAFRLHNNPHSPG
ncbi:MAG: NAD-dependent epimerase/dehydratase family protein [Planctomycetota bacterium]|nr:NAD-dependent epimerase/dehydratase family protein [Planctomycetota bacterium]